MRHNVQRWLKDYPTLVHRTLEDGHGLTPLVSHLMGWITNIGNLLVAWHYVAARSGHTAGHDGLTADEFSPEAQLDYLKQVRQAILDGCYHHGLARRYRLRKSSGGYRWIEVPNLVDRVVQRAIVQILQPLFDSLFDYKVCGCRPQRSRYDALALTEVFFARGHRVWVAEDLRDAFGSVPLERLMQVVRHYLPCPRLIALIRQAVRPRGSRGLPQGGPLSPLLMNVYCHHFLDLPWRKVHPSIPLVRYVDNLMFGCPDMAEGRDARADLKHMLRPTGLQLKPIPDRTAPAYDLAAGATVPFLGFDITGSEGRLLFCIPERAWENLYGKMDAMHQRAAIYSPSAAGLIADYWLQQMGPAYACVRRDDCFARLFDLARDCGADLETQYDELKQAWRTSYRRWYRVRRNALATVRTYEDCRKAEPAE